MKQHSGWLHINQLFIELIYFPVPNRSKLPELQYPTLKFEDVGGNENTLTVSYSSPFSSWLPVSSWLPISSALPVSSVLQKSINVFLRFLCLYGQMKTNSTEAGRDRVRCELIIYILC